jgi:hypothetical protein
MIGEFNWFIHELTGDALEMYEFIEEGKRDTPEFVDL